MEFLMGSYTWQLLTEFTPWIVSPPGGLASGRKNLQWRAHQVKDIVLGILIFC